MQSEFQAGIDADDRASSSSEAGIKLVRNGSLPSVKGSDAWFTGKVRIDSPFQAEGDGRHGGAIVTFEPGARTNWHTHPAGQTLVVLSGVGCTQCEGGPRNEIRAGDVVWCPCRKRHSPVARSA